MASVWATVRQYCRLSNLWLAPTSLPLSVLTLSRQYCDKEQKIKKKLKKNLETKKHLNAENAFNNNRLPKEIYSDCRVTSEKKTLGGLFFITVFVRIWVNVWRRTVIRNFEQDSNPGPNCQWAYDHFGRLLSWSSRNGRLFGQKSRERKFIVRDYHSAFWIPRRADLNSLLY